MIQNSLSDGRLPQHLGAQISGGHRRCDAQGE
jgi:hypothetical protein